MMWMEARLNLSTIMMAKLLAVSMSSTRRLGENGEEVADG